MAKNKGLHITKEELESMIETYGEINPLDSLSKIQEEIGKWKSLGIQGIYVNNLSNDTFTRKQENRHN